jgi:hypothetical protein
MVGFLGGLYFIPPYLLYIISMVKGIMTILKKDI